MSVTLPGSILDLPTDTVTLPLSIPDLPTATGTFPVSPTAVPSFGWSSHPSTIDTCTSATFNWEYSGPPEALQFVLVSNVSPHSTQAATIRKRAGDITVITTNVNSTALSWTWPKVNVTAGQYVLEVIGTDATVLSSTFSVVDGADTSCLADVVQTRTSASIPSTTTSSSEPAVTPLQTPSGRGTTNIGIIAGGTVAGVVVLFVALLGYRMWARRHRQHLARSGYPSEAAQGALPSPDVASGAEAPSFTEKGTRSTDPSDDTAATSPLAPNRRPPSSLLSEPHTPAPPYISHTQTRERAPGSITDVSTIGSRSSATISDAATSTAGLTRTISSCPPSYLTSPSPPPSYVTHTTRGATTPRSPHWSYASSS